jgi:hypothetical protein
MTDSIFDGGNPLSDFSSTTVGYQPSTRTAQQVITHVQRTFGDADGVQVTGTDIIRWINDAQDTIVNRTRPLKARAFTDSIKGVSSYKFPNENIIQIDSLHYNDSLLENTPFAQAERLSLLHDETIREPETWWEWSGSITLYPTPPVSRRMVIYYSMTATPVVNPGDIIGVPDKYYQTLLSYVMGQAYELDERLDISQQKSNEFSSSLDVFDEEERVAQHMTYEKLTYIDFGY